VAGTGGLSEIHELRITHLGIEIADAHTADGRYHPSIRVRTEQFG